MLCARCISAAFGRINFFMNKTAKSFTIVTGFAIVTRLISFVFKIWMSRALGAQTVGIYQISMSVLSMLFTLTSGAPTVLSRKVAEAQATSDTKRQNSLTTASIILGLSISGGLCALLYGLNARLGVLFSDERCLPIFLIMLPTLVTSTLYASLRSWFWGRKNFLAFSSTELLDEVVRIILAAVLAGGLVSSLSGATGIALAMTLSDAVCVATLGVLYFASGGRLTKPRGFKELTLRTLPLSATRILTALTASLTAIVLPRLLIRAGMSPADATAEYGRVAGMALPLIMAPVMLVSSLSVVLIPDVAELKSKGDMDGVRGKLSAAMLFAMLIAACFFVLYLPLGRHLGTLIFGDSEAGELVSYCSLLLFPISIAQVTTPMLNSLGREKNTFLNTVIGTLPVIPCILLLPKYIGVYAMAVGSGLCFGVTALLNCIRLKKEVGAFVNARKAALLIGFSIPLAVLGMFCERLLTSAAGKWVSVLVVGVAALLLMTVFVNAFKIVDVVGLMKLIRPVGVTSRKKRHARKAYKQMAK